MLSCLILKIFVFTSLTIDNKKAIKKKRCYISNLRLLHNLIVIIYTLGPTQLWKKKTTFIAILSVFECVVKQIV